MRYIWWAWFEPLFLMWLLHDDWAIIFAVGLGSKSDIKTMMPPSAWYARNVRDKSKGFLCYLMHFLLNIDCLVIRQSIIWQLMSSDLASFILTIIKRRCIELVIIPTKGSSQSLSYQLLDYRDCYHSNMTSCWILVLVVVQVASMTMMMMLFLHLHQKISVCPLRT